MPQGAGASSEGAVGSGPKSVRTGRDSRRGLAEAATAVSQAECTSFAKKCNVSGQRQKLGTLNRSCRLDRIDAKPERGRRGRPFFLTPVETAMRDAAGMCKDRCGLVNAHLLSLHQHGHGWRAGNIVRDKLGGWLG